MKTTLILIFAFLVSFAPVHAATISADIPTGATKTEAKNNTKEAESKKTEVKSTSKMISSEELHKLKFPKKFSSKKPRYSFRK